MTGIGGDRFWIHADAAGQVLACNGSGRTPRIAQAAWYSERNIASLEPWSPHTVTVPGAVDAWCCLHKAKGRPRPSEGGARLVLFLPAHQSLLCNAVGFYQERFAAGEGDRFANPADGIGKNGGFSTPDPARRPLRQAESLSETVLDSPRDFIYWHQVVMS